MRLGGVAQQVQRAVACNQGQVLAPIAIEIRRDGRHRGGDFGGRLLELVQAEIAENTVGRQHIADAAIGQIGERQRTLGFQAGKWFELALVVQQQQAVGG